MLTLQNLLADPRNPRTITAEAADGLRASVSTFGDIAGLTWNQRTGQMVAGHQRLNALKAEAARRGVSLHMDGETIVLPAGAKPEEAEQRFSVRVVDWTDQQQAAANLTANNPAIGGMFTEGLGAMLAEVEEALPDLFADTRLAELKAEAERLTKEVVGGTGGEGDEPPEPQTDRAAELAEKWVTAQGQVWEVPSLTVPGRCHRVACGDSTNPDVYRTACGDETPWMMVTDPPYGVEYDPDWRNHAKRADGSVFGASSLGVVENDHRAGWEEAYRLFGGDVAYVWHASWFIPEVKQDLLLVGLEARNLIIWVKPTFGISRGDYHWQHEPCWYVVRKGKAGHRNDDRTQSTVWEIAKMGAGSGDNEATGHGTQKPVECMARPIRNHDFPDARAVYDPFLGSGTTIVAAEREGRICVGAELSPAYVAVILQRLADMGLEPRRVS